MIPGETATLQIPSSEPGSCLLTKYGGRSRGRPIYFPSWPFWIDMESQSHFYARKTSKEQSLLPMSIQNGHEGTLGTLQAFSLIAAEKGGETFVMHRLVQLSTRNWLEL